ncbi:hypothetical protein CC78DRAFT_124338 [Lojkania enalia]|uniref:Uncharacterized protein n=1 Tax=Lojkania enalia TaxID=147567 RepID=A0A9P4N216_9PLEO|nr:hypothetical protein CC78DRAFT_124338 [Didymosphaeria enalia]
MIVLEAISSIAAISQLLGQAITTIQKAQDARARVQGASARLDGYKDQLDSLISTLSFVHDEPELHTPAIREESEVIVNLGKELQRQLDVLAAQLERSKVKQYTHALISGERGEKDLDNAMTRLDRAKADFTARILTAHVGISGTMRTGFIAAMAIIQRVDQNVQRILGQRLAVAARLEGRSLGEESDGTIPLTNEEAWALHLVDKVSYEGNKAFDDAVMVQADLVERPIYTRRERSYINNEAHKTSLVLQGNVDADGLVNILRARRG